MVYWKVLSILKDIYHIVRWTLIVFICFTDVNFSVN